MAIVTCNNVSATCNNFFARQVAREIVTYNSTLKQTAIPLTWYLLCVISSSSNFICRGEHIKELIN